MSRLNRILIGLVVIQVVLALVLLWPRGSSASAAEPLFGTLQADQVNALSISDADGNRTDLAKQAESWVASSDGDYPADATKIDALLEKIAALRTNPLVTRTSASHKRLQVADDDFVRRIDLTLADGSMQTLYIGSAPGGGTHVRVGGQDEVYLTSNLFSYEAGAPVTNWIDPVYLAVPQAQVVAMTLENANGTFEFIKDESGTWTMDGLSASEEFNPNNLTSLLSRIGSLRMTKPLGEESLPEYGMDQAGAVVTVTTRDDAGTEKTQTLTIGVKDEASDGYPVISSQSTFYVRVNTFSVEDFVTRTRDEFIVQPTPTPEATTAP